MGLTSNPELASLSKQHDVPLTAGMESGNIGVKNFETQLERVPFVGTRGAMEAGSGKIGEAAQNLVDHFTPDNPTDIPDQIHDNMLKTLKQGKADVGNIQKQINEAVSTQKVEPIAPDSLREATGQLLKQFPDIFDRLPSTPLKNKLTAIAEGTAPQSKTSAVLDAGGKPITTTAPAELSWNEAMLLREQLNNYISRAYNSAGAVGSKELYQLNALKRGLDADITSWGETSSNANVVDLFKQRNQAYIDKVAPFKDFIVKKATGNQFDTDLLIKSFIKGDRPNLAGKLMDSLTLTGSSLSSMLYSRKHWRPDRARKKACHSARPNSRR